MIGVIADLADHQVVCEFFELFKTPWEWFCKERRYDVILCAADEGEGIAALTLHFRGKKVSDDIEQKVVAEQATAQARNLVYKGNRIPVYGDLVTFPEEHSHVLTEDTHGQSVMSLKRSDESAVIRVGYDLFAEIRKLLVEGQPPANARIPTLDRHIGFLRDLIVEAGIRLMEIPPVPAGHAFIVCLTHDVDHPSIQRHQWDHTSFGFLFRAIFDSMRRLVRRQITIRDVLKNWVAASQLIFVYSGFGRDFWRDFDDRYLELEKGLHATYFLIPFENAPGVISGGGRAPEFRAARYRAADLADTIQKLEASGCEVGLHGIDAWCDGERGSAEIAEIRRLTGRTYPGARMHWLYFDTQSPCTLEAAGAAYDSTVGYNETVGYRAGTMQAYKPLSATRLLELPLHVMDTALFYPSHLGLSPRKANALLNRMADDAVDLGGCLTVNWHDRSLAPERLWERSYRDLLLELKRRDAWFATAADSVAWFRKRRSIKFEIAGTGRDEVRVQAVDAHNDSLPGLRLRIHNAGEPQETDASHSSRSVDISLEDALVTPA